VLNDGPVACLAFRLGFAPTPAAEAALDLAPIVAATPEQHRIEMVGGTEIEDRLSLRGLSVHRIHNHDSSASGHMLVEQAQHSDVGRVTRLHVGRYLSYESLRPSHPIGERDAQLSIDVAASDERSPDESMKALSRRRLARCRKAAHDDDQAGRCHSPVPQECDLEEMSSWSV